MITLGAITNMSDDLRDAQSAAINTTINAGASAPHLIIQTAGGADDLLDFTLDSTSAFVVGATGVISLDLDPAISAEADAGGAPAQYVITDADGNVKITGEASGDTIVAGLVYAIGAFSLTTPAAPS
jgi:hypothetical protein